MYIYTQTCMYVCVCVCVCVCIHVLVLLAYIRYICLLILLPFCFKGNGLNVGLYGAVDLARLLPFAASAEAVAHRGTNFTCCTSTKVHMLTDLARLLPFAASAEACCTEVLNLLAVLVQEY